MTTFCADSAERPKPKITISKETTFITEPVGEDGYVDYQAALNARLSKGVTPENNSALLMLKAFGTKIIDEPIRTKTLAAMSAENLTENGEGFVRLDDYMREKYPEEDLKGEKVGENASDAVDRQESEASSRPWSKKEFPRLAEWLAVNDAALKTIEDASKKERHFIPAVSVGKKGLEESLNVGVMEYRSALKALDIRAMNHAYFDRTEDAWRDIMTCYRLARQATQAPFLTGALIASAFDNLAAHATEQLTFTGKLTAKQARRFCAQLNQLPVLYSFEEAVDFGERVFVLDCIKRHAMNGYENPPEIDGLWSDRNRESARKKLLAKGEIDWDETLRVVNATFDQAAKVGRFASYQEKAAAFSKLAKISDEESEQAIKRIAAKDFDSSKLSPQENGRLFAAIESADILSVLMPAVTTVPGRRTACRDLALFSLALAGYHAEHGAYPKKLAELAPEYFSELPKDPFSDGDFIYRLERDGYILYSVGPNGKDDGGMHFSDSTPENPILDAADDIAIRKK